MNKRVKQLMEQTLDSKFSHTWTTMTYEDLTKFSERFAELIVKQCRDTVAKTRDQAIEDEWNVDEAMSTAMYDIEQHFGA
jgi:hypothetical protein